jgi:phosphate-selective porin
MNMRTMITAVAIALALPAMAKAATPEPDAAPAPAASVVSQAESPQREATPAASTASPVAEKVAADWAKYDGGNKGSLTRAEFGKWMTDLRASASQPAPDASWLKSAFLQTDTDKNAKVTAAELTAFLTAGA